MSSDMGSVSGPKIPRLLVLFHMSVKQLCVGMHRDVAIVPVPAELISNHRCNGKNVNECTGRDMSDGGSHREKPRSSQKRNSDGGRHEDSNVEKLLRYIFLDAKFFLVKSGNHENVALAQAKGVWSSPPHNEVRLNRAFRVRVTVHLLYSFQFQISDLYTMSGKEVYLILGIVLTNVHLITACQHSLLCRALY